MTWELIGSDLKTTLHRLGACREAIDWVGDRDLATAWAECQRPDWMFWLIDRHPLSDDTHKRCVRVACRIARSVLHLIPVGEDRPALAIEAAEAWLAGTGSAVACYAAYDAAYVASFAAAAAADYTAADAACAAAYAANACYTAANAAYAANATAAAASAAANAAAATYADIVRKHFPTPPEVQ